MPQARLTDVNSAAMKYRNVAIASLASQNYDNCFGSLYALNGLLPKEYRVVISTIEYNNMTRQDIFVTCGECGAELDFRSVQVFLVLRPLIETIISGNQYEKVWFCTACKHENKLLKTKMSQTVLKEPYFLKVVPKPPRRKDGLNDRSSYHRKVIQWAWALLDELETQFAQFRDDNWSKKGGMYEEFDDDIGGEEDAETVVP